jgi:DNA polymerase III epsilon subunit-like protein
VKPEGFVIDTKATFKHGISHARALSEGGALSDVMAEFLEDVLAAVDKGGRVVAHNLAFDGEILSNELERSGFGDKCELWEHVLCEGVCTMSPDITHWVRQMIGDVGVPYYVRMSLKEMVQILVPAHKQMLAQHHDAGNDAEMHTGRRVRPTMTWGTAPWRRDCSQTIASRSEPVAWL